MKVAPNDLLDLLKKENASLAIDVLPEDAFAARHIPGAANACVYEVVFLETVENATSGDRSKSLVVYDETDTFETETWPEAVLEITDTAALEFFLSDGLPNTKVTADLTLHGETRPVEFPCLIGRSSDDEIVAQGNFDLDRTQWNIRYGSGRFFEWLGKHIVSDLISLQIKMVVAKSSLKFN